MARSVVTRPDGDAKVRAGRHRSGVIRNRYASALQISDPDDLSERTTCPDGRRLRARLHIQSDDGLGTLANAAISAYMSAAVLDWPDS